MAVTEPLPLVPPTMIEWKLRSGWWSAAQSAVMFSSPNFIPRRSRPKRKSIGSIAGEARCSARLLDRRSGLGLGDRLRRVGLAEGETELQDPGDHVLELAPVDDHVEHAAL